MATKSYELIFNGDDASQTEGSSASLGISGTFTLGRCRVKKSSAGGTCLVNLDCSGGANKFLDLGDGAFDVNPENVSGHYSDGDDLEDIPNSYTGNLMTAATGEEPTFSTAGQNITSKPVIEIGSSSKLKYASSAPEFASGESFTVFVVVDEGGNSERPALGSTNISARDSKATWYGNNASRRTFVQDESGNSITSSAQDYFQDNDIRVLTKDSSNNVKEYRRGVETLSGTLSGTMKFPNLGWATQNVSTTATDYIFNGLKVSRVIICDDYFDDDARENVEAWLAWEYGLQTAGNSYLPSTHIGYQVDPRGTITKSFSSDFDLSSLSANTYSSLVQPSVSTVNGSIRVILDKVYKIGNITVEINVDYS